MISKQVMRPQLLRGVLEVLPVEIAQVLGGHTGSAVSGRRNASNVVSWVGLQGSMALYFADEPEHITLLRDTMRRFVKDELPPEKRRQWDREHRFPPELFEKLAATGVCGITIDEAYGGQGRDIVAAVAVIEELCRGGAFAAGPFIHCAFYGGINVSENGSEEQKQELLPRLARGELLFAYGLSEPEVGGDLASVATTARRDGDEVEAPVAILRDAVKSREGMARLLYLPPDAQRPHRRQLRGDPNVALAEAVLREFDPHKTFTRRRGSPAPAGAGSGP